jgi:hypothetical protein
VTSGEHYQPSADCNKKRPPKRESKHWLEYAIFFFVVVTALATGTALGTLDNSG